MPSRQPSPLGQIPAYLTRRLLAALLLVFLVSSGAFVLTRLAPGDVTSELVVDRASRAFVARERARLGLDRPLATQYVEWLARAARFDLGVSWRYGRPVRELVAERGWNTALLALPALALATLIGVPLGIWTGSRRRGLVLSLVRFLAGLALSLPPLVLALILVFVAARTGWAPIGGMQTFATADLSWFARVLDLIRHLTVPLLALVLPLAAVLQRLQEQTTAEALGEPWLVAALARGVPYRRLVWRHALPHAIKPVAGVYGIIAGSLMSGSFAVEIATAWPGLGRLTYDALLSRDLFLVAGCAAAGSVFLAGGVLFSDIVMILVDPRLREPAAAT